MLARERFSDDYYEKRRRFRIVTAVAPAIVAVSLMFFRAFFPPFYEYQLTITAMALLLFLVSAMAILMIYLQTGFRGRTTDEVRYGRHEEQLDFIMGRLQKLDVVDTERLQEVQDQLSDLKSGLARVQEQSSQLSEEQTRYLVDSLENRIREESAARTLADIEDKIRTQVSKNVENATVSAQFGSTLRRLNTEISALSRRGNLNLVLGIATTVSGLAVLGYYVFYGKAPVDDPWAFTCHFFPRLTLVVFIEIFAYFFLTLYKASIYLT